MSSGGVAISVVVVTHDHEREVPRTLGSLLPPYQQGISVGELEVVLVDNGSRRPAAEIVPEALRGVVQVLRIDDAPPSPARAANVGIATAAGGLIGLIVDGARLASPGLLRSALRASRLGERGVITAPAWHLGPDVQARSSMQGYDAEREDALLAASGWEQDGYRLFDIATPAPSSARGLFGPMGESSSLFLSPALWRELGGLDERFASPGGGLVNHDLYDRACALPDVDLVVLLGEGTFHQVHGGVATSSRAAPESMHAEYEAIRGVRQRPPRATPSYFGTVPPQLLPHVRWSVERAEAALREHAPS